MTLLIFFYIFHIKYPYLQDSTRLDDRLPRTSGVSLHLEEFVPAQRAL